MSETCQTSSDTDVVYYDVNNRQDPREMTVTGADGILPTRFNTNVTTTRVTAVTINYQ